MTNRRRMVKLVDKNGILFQEVRICSCKGNHIFLSFKKYLYSTTPINWINISKQKVVWCEISLHLWRITILNMLAFLNKVRQRICVRYAILSIRKASFQFNKYFWISVLLLFLEIKGKEIKVNLLSLENFVVSLSQPCLLIPLEVMENQAYFYSFR